MSTRFSSKGDPCSEGAMDCLVTVNRWPSLIKLSTLSHNTLCRRVAREALNKSGDRQHELQGFSVKLKTCVKQTIALRQSIEQAISERCNGQKVNITGTSVDSNEI